MTPIHPSSSLWQMFDDHWAKIIERSDELINPQKPHTSSGPSEPIQEDTDALVIIDEVTLFENKSDSGKVDLPEEKLAYLPPRSPKTEQKEEEDDEEILIVEGPEEFHLPPATPKPSPEPPTNPPENGLLDKAKALLKRPVVIAGHNYNTLTPVADAGPVRDAIMSEIGEIRRSVLDGRLLASGELPTLEDPMTSPQNAAPIEEPTVSFESPEMQKEINEFRKKIIAFATFYTLHEVIAGCTPPVNEKDEPVIYQKMISDKLSNPSRSLWDIYRDELGKNLGWVAYFKAGLFYFLFYSLSNFIPKIINELVNSGIHGIRTKLTDVKGSAFLTSEALGYTESILTCINGAMEEFANDAGKNGSLDDYKANAVRKLFSEKRNEKIQASSEKLINLFFPEITFFRWGEGRSFWPIGWIGKGVSSLLNHPTNLLVKWILKTFIIPSVIHTAVQKTISKAPNETYQRNGKLYEVIREQIKKVRENLHNLKENEKPGQSSLLSVAEGQKLATIANLLITIFEAPSIETSANLQNYYKIVKAGSSDALQDAMQKGIVKIGETAVQILYDKKTLDDLLLKTLRASNDTLVSHSNFQDIKNKCSREENELHIEAKALFDQIIQKVIQEKTEADIQAASEKTEKTQSLIRNRLAQMAENFHRLLGIMDWAVRNVDESFARGSDSPFEKYLLDQPAFNHFSREDLHELMYDIRENLDPKILIEKYGLKEEQQEILFVALLGENIVPESAFAAINAFCNQMQDFRQEMDAKALGEKYHLSEADQEILNLALQPLRLQALEMIRSVREMSQTKNEDHLSYPLNEHYLCYALNEQLKGIRSCLSAVDQAMQQPPNASIKLTSLYSPAIQHGQKFAALVEAANIQNFITEEALKKNKEEHQDLLKELQNLENAQAELLDLQQFMQLSGPVAQRVRFLQGDRDPTLKDFHPEEAKRTIREVLQKTKLENSLGPLIDQMQMFIPPTQRKDWDKLEALIFGQIKEDPIKELFKEAFAVWKKLGRGESFNSLAWENHENEFLKKTKDFSYSRAQVMPLLRQVRAFISNDILNAYWHRFLQEVKREEIRRTHQIEEKKEECLERVSVMNSYLDGKFRHLKEVQSVKYLKLQNQIEIIQSQIHKFHGAAIHLQPDTPISTTTTLTTLSAAAGGTIGVLANYFLSPWIAAPLFGVFSSYAASFFSSTAPIDAAKGGAAGLAAAVASAAIPIIPPVVTNAIVGAASLGYVAKEAPNLALGYGQHYITGRLQKILERALTETLKPSTREAFADALLDATAKS